MISEHEIIELIKTWTFDPVSPDDDINLDLGVMGDDFTELMEAFAEKYKVDMKGYLWYFHQ
jgi:Protein of unknown function (DUF1493)